MEIIGFTMKKLFGLGDIKLIIDNPDSKGKWVPPVEMQQVLRRVPDATYVLYSLYRTYPFKESIELEDSFIGKILGWSKRKVQDHRLVLEKAALYKTVRYGSKTDGITKVFVGMDVIALFDAGLPSDILEPKALSKMKKEFNIKSPQDLVDKALIIAAEFEQNPDKYIK